MEPAGQERTKHRLGDSKGSSSVLVGAPAVAGPAGRGPAAERGPAARGGTSSTRASRSLACLVCAEVLWGPGLVSGGLLGACWGPAGGLPASDARLGFKQWRIAFYACGADATSLANFLAVLDDFWIHRLRVGAREGLAPFTVHVHAERLAMGSYYFPCTGAWPSRCGALCGSRSRRWSTLPCCGRGCGALRESSTIILGPTPLRESHSCS